MDCKTKQASASAAILFTFFCLQFLSLSVAGDSSPAYKPIDNIVLDCGFFGNSSVLGDPRIWVGDIKSKYFPSNYHQNGASVNSLVEKQFHSITQAPFISARLSSSEFTYFFSVSPGQKFIRLYFYSVPYLNFDRYKAIFSVRVGLYTLLRDFNASVNADASGSDQISREFCVNVEGNHLNITFTPTSQDSYAFICGIEIVSMPTNLYYAPAIKPDDQGERGLRLLGQNNKFFPVENYTSLEMVYRINIGGNFIAPAADTGMFRSWSRDTYFLNGLWYLPFNTTINLNFSKIPKYTAPEMVYRTSWTMGPKSTLNKSFNLTWSYPVNPGFYYMLRLHFCEFQDQIWDRNDRVFLIYIADKIAETSADVIRWSGGKGIPCFRDYIVFVPHSDDGNQKKVQLHVKLQANPNDFITRFTNVILNGVEIFKLNDSYGNLAGQNPDPPPTTPFQSPPSSILQPKNSNNKTLVTVVPIMIGSVIVMLALGLFVFWRCKTFTKQNSSDKTSWWARYSMATNKSCKTRNSNLPSHLCRYFSLGEIRAATNDFNQVFIIGVGGFGNVYEGCIDDGATQVAIKRLKPGSKQGMHEFKTEIKMLSQLRHLHLVSLIGYCNDENEMILIYDYMSHGTLRSHLYGNNDKQPLPWKQRLQICIGAAKGLHYLHTGARHTVIHRDVKTTNILLDDKWVAKVSDFGLSKVGPMDTFKSHVSTVVKGSFGYLDPEYCRRQQLSEKSDVYSFGVVLCEVLCARPPLMCTADKMHLLLVEWVQRCIREEKITQIIDPKIKNEITLECFRKFIQIVVSCVQDEGIKRPSMNDVVQGLEFASQLQDTLDKENVDFSGLDNGNSWLFGEGISSKNTEVATSTNMNSSFVHNKGMSGIVFSGLKDLEGR